MALARPPTGVGTAEGLQIKIYDLGAGARRGYRGGASGESYRRDRSGEEVVPHVGAIQDRRGCKQAGAAQATFVERSEEWILS